MQIPPNVPEELIRLLMQLEEWHRTAHPDERGGSELRIRVDNGLWVCEDRSWGGTSSYSRLGEGDSLAAAWADLERNS